MKILAMDSATRVAGIALVDGDQTILAEALLNTGKTHSEKLLPLLAEVLNYAGLGLKDLSGIAVTKGPGSFTGLRIGLATAKTLAQVLGLPLVGVPTLDVLSQNAAGSGGLICPLIVARRQEVYTALYGGGDCPPSERRTEYLALSPDQLFELLDRTGETVTFLGDAVQEYQRDLTAKLGGRCRLAAPAAWLPRPSQVGLLALPYFIEGQTADALLLTPEYLRESAAERQLAVQKLLAEGD